MERTADPSAPVGMTKELVSERNLGSSWRRASMGYVLSVNVFVCQRFCPFDFWKWRRWTPMVSLRKGKAGCSFPR